MDFFHTVLIYTARRFYHFHSFCGMLLVRKKRGERRCVPCQSSISGSAASGTATSILKAEALDGILAADVTACPAVIELPDDLAQELAHTLILGICEEMLWRTLFYDLAVRHKYDPVGHLTGKSHFVSDNYPCNVLLMRQIDHINLKTATTFFSVFFEFCKVAQSQYAIFVKS